MASGVSSSGSASQPGGGSPWEPVWSPKHRRLFFFNKETGESLWELPSVSGPSTGTLSRGSSQLATGASPTGTDGGPWHQVWSHKHERHYYYHEVTREVVWELPKGSRPSTTTLSRGASQPATVVRDLPSGPARDPDALIAYERIRCHLGGYGGNSAEHYFSLFGETRFGTAPFGSKVWNGIRELAARNAALGHYQLENIQLGWFQAPQPFSKLNAQLPLESDQWWQMAYPAVFVKLDGELWIVWCLAILLNRGRGWYSHCSRVTLLQTEENVIPPVFRPAFAGGLVGNPGGASPPGAHSASTSTASGTSTPRSLSEVTSSSADGTEFTVIEETAGPSSEEWVRED